MEPVVHTTGKGTIGAFCHICQSSEELLSLLDKKELYRTRLQSISLENRRREWLSVRVLLKALLHEEKEIAYTPLGKPYFSDGSYQLSISHTKGYVAVALNKKYPIGIDIEYISSKVNKIRDRFMSEEENLHLSPDNEEIQLLLHWSTKESLFKVLGEESVDFKSCLHLSPFRLALNEWSSFAAHETKTEWRHRYTVHYLVTDDFVMTMAEEEGVLE